ncbi:A/G-specific adenine glycosylase [Nibricoccus sp. IMCC34717]|uniref:A/G-specific adenine glycosylase n=1 Tax=Nibricoccus sp. IMCC34717 TaxID=3034021 RepID=UPI0038517386
MGSGFLTKRPAPKPHRKTAFDAPHPQREPPGRMPADKPPFDAARFSRALLAWFDAHRRELPWREQPSLYKTVVSEFMLQQTQVKTALPYFERWLLQFPDFSALAAADEAAVLKAWEGLGYYTRARNLLRLAKAVVARGAPPDSVEGWLELPGIGPYTAAAITSIALGLRVACVDGNVVRILTRLCGDATEYPDSSRAAKVCTPLANSLVSSTRPGDHNQAMMELGATVCHRQSPLCTVCPVLEFCVSGKRGEAESLPKLQPKKYEKREIDRLLVLTRGAVLLHRTPGNARRLAGVLELPDIAALGLDAAPAGATLVATRKRAITRWQITERIWKLDTWSAPVPTDCEWVEQAQLGTITLSGPHRRWLSELLGA